MPRSIGSALQPERDVPRNSYSPNWLQCRDMEQVDASESLVAFLSKNRGLDPQNPDSRIAANYGVTATLMGSDLAVVLTFLGGTAYCCMEWGCHLPLFDGWRWQRLREVMAEYGVSSHSRMTLQLKCVVEDGALFFDFMKPDRTRKGWYGFKEYRAMEYDVVNVEGDEVSRYEQA